MQESRYNIWIERPDAAFVFNVRSGALLKIPEQNYLSVRQYIAGDETANCPPAILAYLAAGLMISEGDELDVLASRYKASQDDRSRFSLTIVTSLGCNFDCPYCFEEKHPSIMNEDVQRRVILLLEKRLQEIKSFHVTWFGGEPLVGKKSLLQLSDKFIELCDNAKVDYGASMITNGYLLDLETCKQLAARRVKSVQVGLDGPPETHDRMRPLSNGKGSFKTIVANLHKAVEYFNVTVRVNIDETNLDEAVELFVLLKEEGLSGRLSVYCGRIIDVQNNPAAPAAGYKNCLSSAAFAQAERRFLELAEQFGLASRRLPRPIGAPCTAVRANELVVGSKGELYKCWDSVGDNKEVIGDIRDFDHLNGRLAKWLAYDPFANEDCRQCIALPACMGGCAHHAFDKLRHENRCGTFRHTFLQQVNEFVDVAEKQDPPLNYANQLAKQIAAR